MRTYTVGGVFHWWLYHWEELTSRSASCRSSRSSCSR